MKAKIKILRFIINRIKDIKENKPLLIGIDGIDTAGKTIFADRVQKYMLVDNIFEPVRISIDKFHNSQEKRYRKGEFSPKGFFEDSFNYEAIKTNVINPVKNLDNHIVEGIYDFRTESELMKNRIPINSDTVILFDGIFLNRDELYQFWDLSIFLKISFETMLDRALIRDLELFGSEEAVIKKYQRRYIPGEKIYLNNCQPERRADIVIDNNDYENQIIVEKY
ncbi:MAG: hypothetical protein KGY75_00930 [Candidatus Cloacimonetes bacterium]|nr:hypothetical protein [Candidatus Cloacimonadota bacterium]MBS3766680.1 hypothetical protein [Candidatus Cloacimonadota bacterium]